MNYQSLNRENKKKFPKTIIILPLTILGGIICCCCLTFFIIVLVIIVQNHRLNLLYPVSEILVDGHKRNYILRLPKDFDQNKQYPLVVGIFFNTFSKRFTWRYFYFL
jgi:hypothetical protein